MDTTRTCKDCQIEKPLSQFPLTYGAHGARRHQCSACRAAYMKAYTEAHRKKRRSVPPSGYRRCTICEQILPIDQFYANGLSNGRPRLRSACKSCDIQRVMKYNREHAEKLRRQNYGAKLRRDYGLTQGDYDRLLNQQGGVCAICGDHPRDGHRLAVDHDHRTGRVRGLLCDRCNLALGVLEDIPGALERAIAYLAEL